MVLLDHAAPPEAYPWNNADDLAVSDDSDEAAVIFSSALAQYGVDTVKSTIRTLSSVVVTGAEGAPSVMSTGFSSYIGTDGLPSNV
jgi:hypothetical protein